MSNDDPAEIRTAAMLGLGLIGGSLARDLSARGVRVFGWDGDMAAIRAAHAERIAEPLLWNEPVDVIVVAVPVLAARSLLTSIAEKAEGVRLIMDVGSTKRSTIDLAERLGIGDRFVGSHPLAGDHRSGWDASRTGLFQGARVFLCPTSATRDQAMRLASELWTGVGARPEVMGAAEHDERLAWTSHLPQLVSTALALALQEAGIPRGELGPGGRDVTRLAGSSPQMWSEILIDNADALACALPVLEAWLTALRRAYASGDREQLVRFFSEARDWHGQDP